MEFIQHVTKEFAHQINNSKINPISIEVVEQVKNTLAPQPWPKDEHRRVAALLNITPEQVSKAIRYLIRVGEFYEQRRGVLIDRKGNVIR